MTYQTKLLNKKFTVYLIMPIICISVIIVLIYFANSKDLAKEKTA